MEDKTEIDCENLPKKNNGLLAVVASDDGLAESIDQTAAIAGARGTAYNNRYGIAYCPYGGHAKGGAQTVSVAHGGKATSGDGGCSRFSGYNGMASVGSYGVAILTCPGDYDFGKISGGKASALIITYRTVVGKNKVTRQKVAQVGDQVNGITIQPNTFYTLDPKTFDWIAA